MSNPFNSFLLVRLLRSIVLFSSLFALSILFCWYRSPSRFEKKRSFDLSILFCWYSMNPTNLPLNVYIAFNSFLLVPGTGGMYNDYCYVFFQFFFVGTAADCSQAGGRCCFQFFFVGTPSALKQYKANIGFFQFFFVGTLVRVMDENGDPVPFQFFFVGTGYYRLQRGRCREHLFQFFFVGTIDAIPVELWTPSKLSILFCWYVRGWIWNLSQ